MAPGNRRRGTRAPPSSTAASARVVGIPSECIDSLTRYSRNTGPSAARPSPPAREGRSPAALQLDVAPRAVAADHLAEENRAAIAKLRNELSELMARISRRDRIRAGRNDVARKDRRERRCRACHSSPSSVAKRGIELDQPADRLRRQGRDARRISQEAPRSYWRTPTPASRGAAATAASSRLAGMAASSHVTSESALNLFCLSGSFATPLRRNAFARREYTDT